MQPHHYHDLIVRAVGERGGEQLGLIIAQLEDAERAKEILRAKGYGSPGMSASTTAALVPDARVIPL